jgi:glyceraldehyde 3-phosphate dehydrogenase
MLNIAINGLGRIGRAALKIALDKPTLRVTAVNDVLASDNLAYLLKFDTVYGRWTKEVRARENGLSIDGKDYPVLNERDPAKLSWRQMGIDVVFECTGVFRQRDELMKHIEAGARFVILSAPAKSEDVPTVIHAVNRFRQNPAQIISCASCTTNCITPVVEIMGR